MSVHQARLQIAAARERAAKLDALQQLDEQRTEKEAALEVWSAAMPPSGCARAAHGIQLLAALRTLAALQRTMVTHLRCSLICCYAASNCRLRRHTISSLER